ncbi:MAG: aminoglycoside phosphotransferase family protein [Burkholderiaceae bacterium]
MHSDDFSTYKNDPALVALSKLTSESLRSVLSKNIDTSLLDTNIENYSVCNLRYKPQKKMILSLTATGSQRPISIRIFPSGELKSRLRSAQRHNPKHVFSLPELDGLAWIFPGERKLQLGVVSDFQTLKELLQRNRGFEMNYLQLKRFVPEHTYTAIIDGRYGNESPVTEYLKLHYNNTGCHTALMMREVADQLSRQRKQSLTIETPLRIGYLPAHRLLMQSALRRAEAQSLNDANIARALAQLHGLKLSKPGAIAPLLPEQVKQDLNELLDTTYPHKKARINDIWKTIQQQLVSTALPDKSHLVPVHGDVHLGNFFPLQNGNLGIIDFDSMKLDKPETDLCGFYGFKLWLALRNKESISDTLSQFPEFISNYNSHAKQPVFLKRAYLVLAEKVISERIRRGLARGKLSGEVELIEFMSLAEQCLSAAEDAPA